MTTTPPPEGQQQSRTASAPIKVVIAILALVIIAIIAFFALTRSDDEKPKKLTTYQSDLSLQAILNNVQTSVSTETRLVGEHVAATTADKAGSIEQQMHKLDVQIVQGLDNYVKGSRNVDMRDRVSAYEKLYRQWMNARDQQVLFLSRINDTVAANAAIEKYLKPLEAQLTATGGELVNARSGKTS